MTTPDPLQLTLWCLGAFLSGSIPFGLVLVKLAGKGDVRQHGSGNIGATNVSRVGGKGLGILVLLLDVLKGAVPVLLAKHFFSHAYGVAALVSAFAVLGHVFTPWLRFKGGKGVATGLGVLVATGGWIAAAPALGVFVVALVLFRMVSLGSILAAAVIPFTAKALFFMIKTGEPTGFWGNDWNWLVWCAVSILIIAKHHENIRRLLSGTESKLWGGKAKEATDA